MLGATSLLNVRCALGRLIDGTSVIMMAGSSHESNSCYPLAFEVVHWSRSRNKAR